MFRAFLLTAAGAALAVIAGPSAAFRAADPATPAAPQTDGSQAPTGKICKYVVSAEKGAKPYQLCLSEAAWAAREKIAAKDATRTECHYVPKTGWHFESVKVCMPASEWENQRRADQQAIQSIQRSVCVPGAGCH